jgi:GAF domain-containing protein
MIIAEKPANEQRRLRALWASELLDTPSEDAFDALTSLAANLCDLPIALVSLVDANRQWFKSKCGLDGVITTHRDVSFCAHAILQVGIFEVNDARQDARFADSPLVTGQPGIRFYAGVPLVDAVGLALGTLCVMDLKPGRLTEIQKGYLTRLATAVVGIIAMRVRRSELDEYQRAVAHIEKAHVNLRKRSELLRSFARAGKSGVLRRTLPSGRRQPGAA